MGMVGGGVAALDWVCLSTTEKDVDNRPTRSKALSGALFFIPLFGRSPSCRAYVQRALPFAVNSINASREVVAAFRLDCISRM